MSGAGGATAGSAAFGGREARGGSSGGHTVQGGTTAGGQAALGGSSGALMLSNGGSGGVASGSSAGDGGNSAGLGGTDGSAGHSGGGASGSAGHSGGGASGSAGHSAGGASAGSATGGASGSGGAMCSAPAIPPAAGCGITGKVTLDYLPDVASATQLSFSVRLRTAEWYGPAPLNQIEVQYYLSLEEDSGFQAQVDSFVSHGPAPSADYSATGQVSIVKLEPAQKSSSAPGACQTHFIRIRNTSTAEIPPATQSVDSYFEFHVTLTAHNAAAPNQVHTNDQSYRPSSTFQSNTGMGVFLCGQLVSGCTPGDGGTCP